MKSFPKGLLAATSCRGRPSFPQIAAGLRSARRHVGDRNRPFHGQADQTGRKRRAPNLISRYSPKATASGAGGRLGRGGRSRSDLLALDRRALGGGLLRGFLRPSSARLSWRPSSAAAFLAPFFTAALRVAFLATTLRAPFLAAVFLVAFFAAAFFTVFFAAAFFAGFLAAAFAIVMRPSGSFPSRALFARRKSTDEINFVFPQSKRTRCDSNAFASRVYRIIARAGLAWRRARKQGEADAAGARVLHRAPTRRARSRRTRQLVFTVMPCFPRDSESRRL